jgi:hypothetical protein
MRIDCKGFAIGVPKLTRAVPTFVEERQLALSREEPAPTQ